MRPHRDIEEALERFGPNVWRTCLVYFRAHEDAQDAYQETFLRYALADDVAFSGDDHRRAWLIRVSANVCKDMLRKAERKNSSLETAEEVEPVAPADPLSQPGTFTSDAIDALRALDDPPRTPVYLAICEGYTASEIAAMLESPVNTVYSWIARGKKALKEALA